MFTHELTREQQQFAEENHDMIYRFLHSKRLPQRDYYDVVVFGYLRAVRQYCSRADLRERYDFGAVAWCKMRDELAKHFKAQSRPSRKAVTVSFEAVLYGEESSFTLAEAIPGPDREREFTDARLLFEQITGLLDEDQTETLRLRMDGYTDREIAVSRNRRVRDIRDIFAGIQAAVLSLV